MDRLGLNLGGHFGLAFQGGGWLSAFYHRRGPGVALRGLGRDGEPSSLDSGGFLARIRSPSEKRGIDRLRARHKEGSFLGFRVSLKSGEC